MPGGETLLHKLADKEDEIIALFKICHPDLGNPKPKIHVPFLPNVKGESALHKCADKEDYKSIDTILKYLKFYPTDHHSRCINSLYGDFIEKDVTEFMPYLESRF